MSSASEPGTATSYRKSIVKGSKVLKEALRSPTIEFTFIYFTEPGIMLLATGTKLKFRRPAGAIKVPRNVPRYVKQYRIFSVEFSYKEYLVIHLYSLFDLPFKKKNSSLRKIPKI